MSGFGVHLATTKEVPKVEVFLFDGAVAAGQYIAIIVLLI
jgi:hypothetical protein